MYVYRFINKSGEILYVGKTVNMSRRMGQHFSEKGHLPKECYSSVKRIEFMKFDTEVDSLMAETYFINLYKPKYNKLNKVNQTKTPTLLRIEPNFKIYKEFGKVSTVSKSKMNFVRIAIVIGFWSWAIMQIINMLK